MTMIQEIINFESRVRNPSQRALDRFFQQPSTRSSFTCHREIRKCIKEGRRIMRQTLEPRDGEVEERVGRFNEEIDPTSIQNRWIRFSVKIELCPWPISWWFSFYYEGGKCVRQGIYSKNMPRIHNTHGWGARARTINILLCNFHPGRVFEKIIFVWLEKFGGRRWKMYNLITDEENSWD